MTRDRAGSWDIGAHLTDTGSLSLSGDEGSSIDIEGELGWGFSAIYNVTNRLAVGVETDWVKPNYRATRVLEGTLETDTIRAELGVFNLQAKGIYNFLEGHITPYVEVGIGWTDIDSNIISGPPTTGCWWDPWWGYVCDTFFDTYSETRSSIAGAVGLRWELGPTSVVKASYGTLEVDTARATEDASLDTFRIEFAWRY
jgi:opacity protein-like surface antigen